MLNLLVVFMPTQIHFPNYSMPLNTCTCTLAAAVLSFGSTEQPAVKVFLPKLRKPHIPAIVLQGEARKVFIKSWNRGKRRKAQFRTNYQPILTWRKWSKNCGGSRGAQLAARCWKKPLQALPHQILTMADPFPLKPHRTLITTFI